MQPLGRLLYKYNSGEKVVIKIDSSIHGGMPHSDIKEKVCVVTEQRGRAYILAVVEENKIRELIVRPEHLVPYTDAGGA